MVLFSSNETEDPNTMLRQNTIASKMFKFYSKLVGTRYLFFTLARVVNELNTLAAPKEKELTSSNNFQRKTSLLAFEMEVLRSLRIVLSDKRLPFFPNSSIL
jgi:hypothetical protein